MILPAMIPSAVIAWLAETLVAATGLMLLVLLLRQPVRRVFGAQVAYALWLLPALRMVLPPLGSLLPQDAPVVQASAAVGALVRARIDAGLAGLAKAGPGLDPGPVVSGAPAWPMLLVGLWLLGMLAFLGWQALSYRRFCASILSGAVPREELAPGVLLVTSATVRGPMAFGLRKRFVVFPSDADRRFDAEERQMALAHELAHHQRGDLLANAVALAVLALHWCNPVAWFAYRAFRTDQELACDADVIASVRGSALGHAYGRALVKSASGREFAAVCNLTTVDRLKRRIAMLSTQSPSRSRRRIGLLLTGALMVSGLALTASGQGMAAQVGAKVSAALPVARAAAVAPVVSAPPVAPIARAAQAAAAPQDRVMLLADATDAARPPAPPAPPVPGAAAAPPAPPAAGTGERRVFVLERRNDGAGEPDATAADGQDSKKVVIRNIKVAGDGKGGDASWDGVVPEIDVKDADNCDPGNPVKTNEDYSTVDGKQRRRITVLICQKDIAQGAREEALKGLQRARDELAAGKDIGEAIRNRIVADLDRQIARLKTPQTK